MVETYYTDIENANKPTGEIYVNKSDSSTNLEELRSTSTGESYSSKLRKQGRVIRGRSSPTPSTPTQEVSQAPVTKVPEVLTTPQPTVQELLQKKLKEPMTDVGNPYVKVTEVSPNKPYGVIVRDIETKEGGYSDYTLVKPEEQTTKVVQQNYKEKTQPDFIVEAKTPKNALPYQMRGTGTEFIEVKPQISPIDAVIELPKTVGEIVKSTDKDRIVTLPEQKVVFPYQQKGTAILQSDTKQFVAPSTILPKREVLVGDDLTPKLAETAVYFTPYVGATVVGAMAVKGSYQILKGKQESNPQLVTEGFYNVLPATIFASAKLASLTGQALTAKSASKVRVGQTIREIKTDKQGNVFVVTRPQTAPIVKETFAGSPVMINGKQFMAFQVGAKEYVPAQYANIEYKNPVVSSFFSPEQIKVNEPNIFSARTTTFLIDQSGRMTKPAGLQLQKEGANYKTFYLLKGSSKEYSAEEFKQLPKILQNQILKQEGIKVFEEGNTYSFGTSETVKLGRSTGYQPKSGLRTSISSDVVELKQIFETDYKTIYSGKASGQDISLPTQNLLSRAKSSDSDVFGVIAKPSLISEESSTGDFIIKKSFGTSKAQLKTLGLQLEAVKQAFPKPSITYPKITNQPAPSVILDTSKTAPVIVGGLGQEQSLYYAKGGIATNTNENVGSLQVETPTVSNISITKVATTLRPKENFISVEIPKQNTLPDVVVKSGEGTRQESIPIQVSPQIESPIQSTVQKQTSPQVSSSLSRSSFGKVTPTIVTPIVKTKIKKPLMTKPSLVSKVRQAFNVVVWKGGKEQIVARNLPKGLATQAAVKNVLSTLRASFKLRPAGNTTQEDINYEMPRRYFQSSKRDISRFVQVKNTRLGSRTEVGEIQMFRKRKAGKIKWF